MYIVAALLKTGAFDILHVVFTSHYLLPESEAYGSNRFVTFDAFYGYSETLQILAPEGRKLLAPAAELIKRQADRTDIPFTDVMQAELLVLMMAFIIEGTQWYPQTLHYSSRSGAFPFFLRAAQHRHFEKLAKITGISDADELRQAVKAGHQRLNVSQWHNFWFRDRLFWESMNMDALDTLK